MAEQGRRGTGWALVIGAAILYLLASTLHLDFFLFKLHLDLGVDGAEQHGRAGVQGASAATKGASPVPQLTRRESRSEIGKWNIEQRIAG